jgi:glycosyltransferase involved in cell wall biosynthesis
MAENNVEFEPDDFEYNPAKRAEKGISAAAAHAEDTEYVEVVDEELREKGRGREASARASEAALAAAVEAAAERAASSVVESAAVRNDARLLVITRDRAVFSKDSAAARRMLELGNLFSEVHVIVLTDRRGKAEASVRLGSYVWLYPTNSRSWWRAILDARRIARTQLQFGGSFRPDLVIAEDPFEAGLAGRLIARKYRRPLQVQVGNDFLDPGFKKRERHNGWRLRFANRVLPRATCVRTQSAYMRARLIERYGLTKETVEILPVFYNLNAWRDAAPSVKLALRYPQFRFILLHVSSMNELSYSGVVIDGLFYILRQYPTIGLVIVGEGPASESLKTRVAAYGLSGQIVFEPPTVDLLSYIQTANVVIHTSAETALDRIVLMAAAVEVPLVCGAIGVASELFIDGQSVLLCPVDSPPCFGEKVNMLLNDNALRQKLALNARDEVFARVEQDYTVYANAYRASIERCLIAPAAKEEPAPPAAA